MADQNPYANPNFGSELLPKNPYSDPNYGAPPGEGYGSVIGRGLARGAAGLAQGLGALPAAGLAVIGDKLRGDGETTAQDWAFKNLVDPLKEIKERNAPTAEEAASIPKSVVGGLAEFAPSLPLMMAGGGIAGKAAGFLPRLAGAMAPIAVSNAANTTAERLDQNVDMSTAFKSGALSGLTTLAMGTVPIAARGGVLVRAATGAVSGAVTNELARRAQNEVMSDHPNLEQKVTPQGVITSALTGSILGAVMGPRPLKAQIAAAKADATNNVNTGDAPPPPPPPPPAQTIVPIQDWINQQTGVSKQKYANQADYEKQFLAAANEPTGQRIAEVGTWVEKNDTALAAVQRRAGLLGESAPTKADVAEYLKQQEVKNPDGTTNVDATNTTHESILDSLSDEQATQRMADYAKQEADAEAARLAAKDVEPLPPSGTPVSDRTNTQLQDAMLDAQRQKVSDDATREADLAWQDKVKSDAAERDRHMTAIWEITKAREQAEAAARGEVPPNTVPLAAPKEAILAALRENVPEENVKKHAGLLGKLSNDVSAALEGKQTFNDQIDAVAALRDKVKSGSTSFEYLDQMVKNLEAKKEPTSEQANAPEAAPAEAVQAETKGPASTEIPGAAKGESAAANVAKPDAVQTAADALTAARAAMNDKARSGALLTDAEKTRMEDMTGVQKALQAILDDPSDRNGYRTVMDGQKRSYADEMTAFAHDLASGKDNLARRADINTEVHSPGLDAAIRLMPDADRVAGFLAQNGSKPWIKTLAAHLQTIGLKTTIDIGPVESGLLSDGAVGGYNRDLNHIRISEGHVSEATVLHELLHAATQDRITQAQQITVPRNEAEARLRQSYNELEAVRESALRRATPDQHYGLTDAHEFMAELHVNPEFRAFLAKKSLWQRTAEAIQKMLGFGGGDSRTLLDRALEAKSDFIGRQQFQEAQQARVNAQEFDASPQGAAKVTDNVLSRAAQLADDDRYKVNLASLSMKAYRDLMGWKTVQYIADRVRAIPELAGFSKYLDSYEEAYKTRNIASNYVESAPAKFAQKFSRMLDAIQDANVRREVNKTSADIGVSSSIGGFEPNLNFDANLKIHPDLLPENKAFIDGQYRKFKQLEHDFPEAAQGILEGAKINRKNYVLDSATVMSNVLEAASNNARRLEAELARMDPNDADRARMQTMVTRATAEAQLANKYGRALDFMDERLKTAPNGNPAKHLDGTSFTLDKTLRDLFTEAKMVLPPDVRTPDKKLIPGSALRQKIGEWERQYTNQVDNPYYHAGRSGDYFVNVGFKNMDDATWQRMSDALKDTTHVLGNYKDQDHAFFRLDTADEAVGLRRKLEGIMGDKTDMQQNASGELMTQGQISNNAGISQALRSVLSDMHETVKDAGLTGADAAMMQDVMTRKFMSMLPESSSRLATVRRIGVPGFDGNFLGSFAKRANGGVMDTANIYSMRAYSDAFKGMREETEMLARSGDMEMQQRAKIALDEITKRYNNSMKPIDTSHVNMINSFGHSFYLALAPAFYIRTMAQPYHRGLPLLGSRFGFINAAKEIAGGTATAMKVIERTISRGYQEGGWHGILDADMNFKDMGLTPKEESFVQELHDRGVLNLGQSRQLQKMALESSQGKQDLMRFASMTAQYAEMTNRLATGLAAFRLAEKGKAGVPSKGTAANTEYAIKAIDYTMDNFDPNNTARQIGKHGFSGKVTPLMTAFLNYNFQTMQQIARTVHDGMFNRDTSPEGVQRAKEARYEFAGLMGTTAMISGVLGLPFANAFAGVYNALTKDRDDPSDIRLDTRNFLAKNFGPEAGGVIAHGIGNAIGVSTDSFGLQNLLPGSEFLASRRLLGDRWDETAKGLMGPALNAGMDVTLAMSKLYDGNYVKGIEQALPAGLKGYWKAGEMATRGYTDAKGDPIGITPTGWDIASQALGLRPSDRASQAGASDYFKTNQALLNDRRQVLSDQFFRARYFGDEEGTKEVMDKIMAFNQANPLQRITDFSGIMRGHLMQLALAQANGGVNVTKKQFPIEQRQVQFNAMPTR